MRLIQLSGPHGRRVGHVEEGSIRLLSAGGPAGGPQSIYELTQEALSAGRALGETVARALSSELLDYDAIYESASEWRILPAIDHPAEPARCMVSGTGLSHTASARNRQAMHAPAAGETTDSMRMFQWGIAGGRP